MVHGRSHQRRTNAFTLVELSIVIAIIGILASVAGSQYLTFLDRARVARAIVELRGIAAQIDGMGDDNSVLPDSLADVGISTVDPWGNTYQFLKIDGNLPRGVASAGSGGLPAVSAGGGNIMGRVRKDRFLVPINSDFDLYSVGPDGESASSLNAKKSRDDVIRAANGAFYGIAEKF